MNVSLHDVRIFFDLKYSVKSTASFSKHCVLLAATARFHAVTKKEESILSCTIWFGHVKVIDCQSLICKQRGIIKHLYLHNPWTWFMVFILDIQTVLVCTYVCKGRLRDWTWRSTMIACILIEALCIYLIRSKKWWGGQIQQSQIMVKGVIVNTHMNLACFKGAMLLNNSFKPDTLIFLGNYMCKTVCWHLNVIY